MTQPQHATAILAIVPRGAVDRAVDAIHAATDVLPTDFTLDLDTVLDHTPAARTLTAAIVDPDPARPVAIRADDLAIVLAVLDTVAPGHTPDATVGRLAEALAR